MILQELITSTRLTYQCLDPRSISEDYLRWMSDRSITRFLEVPSDIIHSQFSLGSYIQTCNLSQDQLLLGIYLRETKSHIGNIKLGPISGTHSRSSVGFVIGDKENWFRGYATEAIETVCKFAFSHFKLVKITAGCYKANEGSKGALLKAGFEIEGQLRAHVAFEGSREDVILFAKFPRGNEG